MKRKRLILLITLLLAITLSGWTQSYQRWKVISDTTISKDTIVQYNFDKSDLVNLRLYIIGLEKFENLYYIDENIIKRQTTQLSEYKTLDNNNQKIISDQKAIIIASQNINETLNKQVTKYKKKANRWPYWLGTGFIGGIVLCLSIK